MSAPDPREQAARMGVVGASKALAAHQEAPEPEPPTEGGGEGGTPPDYAAPEAVQDAREWIDALNTVKAERDQWIREYGRAADRCAALEARCEELEAKAAEFKSTAATMLNSIADDIIVMLPESQCKDYEIIAALRSIRELARALPQGEADSKEENDE